MAFLGQAAPARRSRFIERWAQAEHASARLAFALASVSLLCLGLLIALVLMALKPRPIYYIPGAWQAGIATPQSMPSSAVAAFVSAWALNWSNFTPVTVEDVYKRAQRFMAPGLLGEARARLSKDIEEVKRNNISSLFTMTQEPSVMPGQGGFMVTVRGDKGVYVGKEEIKTQHMIYKIRVRMVNPTDINPYGLVIEAIDQETS